MGQAQVVGEGSALARAIAETASARPSSTGRPAAARPRWRASWPARRGPRSRSCRRSPPRSPTSRAVPARATERLAPRAGRDSLLDEIHRFNKAQQDALLPAVESDPLTLIGAKTTENPYFEVNSALLSRTQVYELNRHPRRPGEIVRRGRGPPGRGSARRAGCLDRRASRWDARNALNVLELAWSTAQSESSALEERHVEDAARRRPVVYDKGGDAHYDFTRAFVKAIRGSDPDAALYYLAAMLRRRGSRYIARRA